MTDAPAAAPAPKPAPTGPLVTSALDGPVGILTLNNGAKRNALSEELLDTFISALEGLQGHMSAPSSCAPPPAWACGPPAMTFANSSMAPAIPWAMPTRWSGRCGPSAPARRR